jgi:hypothetical protein
VPQDLSHVSRLRPTIKEIFYTDPGTRDAATQEEYEHNFYARLKLANDVHKTTHTRRLDDVNRALNELLPRGRRLELLDVGISSGVSTMEWLAALRADGIDAHVIGGDLDIKAYVISLGPWVEVLIDRTGYVLQMDLGSRSITKQQKSPRLRRALLALPHLSLDAAFKVFWMASPALRRHVAEGGSAERRFPGGARCRPLALLSPRLHTDPNLEVIEDDIVANAERFADRFDAIRAANVLNFYLDPQMLAQMLKTLKRRLRVDGLLVLCRTDMHKRNRGTIFRMNHDRRLEVVCRLAGGSEIERFVLSDGDPATLSAR